MVLYTVGTGNKYKLLIAMLDWNVDAHEHLAEWTLKQVL